MITEFRDGFSSTRCHTIPWIGTETVGHHSANVAAILLRLNPDCRKELLVAALTHDLAEAYTGDMPAVCKWENPELAAQLELVEDEYLRAKEIPLPELTGEEHTLLHVADTLDLILSCHEQINMGNRMATDVIHRCISKLDKMNLHPALLERCDVIVREVQDRWTRKWHNNLGRHSYGSE